MAALASSMKSATILSKSSWLNWACSYSILGLPISETIWSMKSICFLISSWAFTMPAYMISSGISSAPASIMTTFSRVAATVTSMRLVLRCSWLGFSTI